MGKGVIVSALDWLFPSRVEKRQREEEFRAMKERLRKSQDRATQTLAIDSADREIQEVIRGAGGGKVAY